MLDVDEELVHLDTAHVGVAHEEQCIVVLARGGRHIVQLHLGLLLQRESLDGQQRVVLGVANHHPPALLSLLLDTGEHA